MHLANSPDRGGGSNVFTFDQLPSSPGGRSDRSDHSSPMHSPLHRHQMVPTSPGSVAHPGSPMSVASAAESAASVASDLDMHVHIECNHFPSKRIDNLTTGYGYRFRVCAKNGVGESEYSPWTPEVVLDGGAAGEKGPSWDGDGNLGASKGAGMRACVLVVETCYHAVPHLLHLATPLTSPPWTLDSRLHVCTAPALDRQNSIVPTHSRLCHVTVRSKDESGVYDGK